jgi:imidazole glycerol-phosphate synthase subunit HisH
MNKNRETVEYDILAEVPEYSQLYFVHSLLIKPKKLSSVVAYSNYADIQYCSVIQQDKIYGFQFHPEKNGEFGLQILNRFLSASK